jgi:hypothetical protein
MQVKQIRVKIYGINSLLEERDRDVENDRTHPESRFSSFFSFCCFFSICCFLSFPICCLSSASLQRLRALQYALPAKEIQISGWIAKQSRPLQPFPDRAFCEDLRLARICKEMLTERNLQLASWARCMWASVRQSSPSFDRWAFTRTFLWDCKLQCWPIVRRYRVPMMR